MRKSTIPPRPGIEPVVSIKPTANGMTAEIGYTAEAIDEMVRRANEVLDEELMKRLAEQHGYVKERTCENVNADDSKANFICSECGLHIHKPSIGRSYLDENGKRWYATTREHGFNYCPSCGARVVKADD